MIDGFPPGLIYIVNQLDYEIQSKYELIVRATDSVTGVYSEVPVNINVVDANDCPPEFTLNEYNLTISEGTPFGTAVLSVSAVDSDSGTTVLAFNSTPFSSQVPMSTCFVIFDISYKITWFQSSKYRICMERNVHSQSRLAFLL